MKVTTKIFGEIVIEDDKIIAYEKEDIDRLVKFMVDGE